MFDADVLVIGGGPAGAAAALTCAAAGYQVIVLESRSFPRSRPGETLHPGVEPLLNRLGVAGVLPNTALRHSGVWSDWGRGAVFQPYGADADGPWLGWQVNRGELDGGLLCQTVQAGVKVLQPVRATAALVEQRRVVGVQTPNGALTARWTVDAAGGRHFLARQLRLPIRRMSPRLVAWYGYVRGCCPTRDTAPLVTAASDGWVWTARVAVERYAWVRLSWRPGRQPPPPDEFDGLVPEGSIHGVDVTWRVVEPAAGPGFFLCGDAGAILDPSAAHGVIRGLISGMMAGHLISHSYGNELSAAKAYDDWLTDRFDADSTALRELYRVHPTPPSWT